MNNFLREYLQSLKEDGELDWVIANIGIAKGWSVLRLPFGRSENGKIKLKKGESEFGIDLSFFADNDRKELVIVALKDERLTSVTWKKENIQNDLLEAISVPLERKPYQKVEQIVLIFAHNKDENRDGDEAYERFASQHRFNETRTDGTRVPVRHERWNLERICYEIETNIFTADILPRQFTGALHYLCSQIKEFEFGSTKWVQITQPTWTHLVKSVLKTENRDRAILTINFCLSVIKLAFDEKPHSNGISPGYIDLYELGMLAASHICEGKVELYNQTRLGYFEVLQSYFQENVAVFRCPDAFDQASFMGLTAIRSAHLAFWNMGRLALFIRLMYEIQGELPSQELKSAFRPEIDHWVNLLIVSLMNNDAIFRPLIDLHHIELYLIWSVMIHEGKIPDIHEWLQKLTQFLAVRRSPNQVWELPFIESYSRMDLVAEFAVTQQRPIGFMDQTSYLVMMLVELSSILPPEQHREIVVEIVSSIVMPSIVLKEKHEAVEPLKLVSWAPPANWATEILNGGMAREGTLKVVAWYGRTTEEIADELIETVRNARLKSDSIDAFGESPVIQILASVRYRSPLPPVFWRRGIKAPEFY